MTHTKKIISLILNLSIVVMEIIAITMSFMRQGTHIFVYFTENSNIFAGISGLIVSIYMIIGLAKGNGLPEWVKTLKYVATGALTLTFFIVVMVLAPTAVKRFGGLGASYIQYLTYNSNLFTHTLCPLTAIISFLFFDEFEGSIKTVFIAVIPTLLYAVISTVLNIAKVWYGPYVFLKVYEQPVWLSVCFFFAIPGISFFFNWILYIIKRKKQSSLA